MPAKSKSQQRLMQAAEHGADFPKAAAIRQSMSLGEMRDFAVGSMKGKPERVKAKHPTRHLNLGKFLHPKKGAK